jgi:3-phenylpropionate/trans-cinnamate dioxygenase ferredoxin reductase subunit
MTEERVVIVGASLAAASVAETLRAQGFEGPITMIGEEPYLPYERPPLSKEILAGTKTIDDAYVRPASFYEDGSIDVRVGRVGRVDVSRRRVRLASGDAEPFDRLVIATGGRPRRPRIPGIDLEGVYTLRTIDDARAIREAARSGRKVVVVGLGFIGSEVASSLRQRGLEVSAIDAGPAPLAGPLGPGIAGLVERMHRDQGVELVLGQTVDRFVGTGSVEAVVTSGGRVIDGDVVVVGLGMEPNVELVHDTPIEVGNGILVDAFGRTSVSGIHAVGDVANHWHPIARRRLRVEHWNNAVKQGRAVARDIVGSGKPYDEVHSFWTVLYGEEIEYYGLHEPWDDVVVRGDLAAHDFTAICRKDGRVVAVIGMGRPHEMRRLKHLIADRAELPAEWVPRDGPLAGVGT